MAPSIDWPNKLISVPQADLTLVSGTLYSMDTEGYFRTQVMAQMDDADGIAYDTVFSHFRAPTIAGVDYGRFLEIINGYQVEFTPDSQWSVILSGSNNNIWDVEGGVLVQNQVQVIPQNSAGLQIVTQGSGVLPADITAIGTEVLNRHLRNTTFGLSQMVQIMAGALAGELSGAGGTNITIRNVEDTGSIIVATVDANGNRSSITITPPTD